MRFSQILMASSVAGVLGLAGAANADPISIRLSEPGFPSNTTTVLGIGSINVTLPSYGTFGFNSITGADTDELGGLPSLLDSISLNTSTITGGTLTIDVMAQNLNSGSPFFQSAFTNNGIPFGWTVTESTFLNAANTNIFGGVLLSTHTFSCLSPGGCGAQAFNPLIAFGNHGALFAATDEFVISATGEGSSLSTINLNPAVPEASTWAMMLVGFASVGFVAYRQKRRQTVFRVA